MNYAKIKSIEVFNFMVYKHAKVNYDGNNIINMKGYNNSGKSTMLKALAICFTDMYKRIQTKFIRHGEKYFRVIVSFDDGVSILRDKYISGQSLYEVYKDDECIYTTKAGGKLTKIDGVPEVIQNYLGLCMTSTGCLNYQVRQDPLWLIETTGSENYNCLNEILKTEEISTANTILNSDKNKLNSEITMIEASLKETESSLISVQDYTPELLDTLKSKEEYNERLVGRMSNLEEVSEILSELKGIREIPNIEGIDSTQLNAIEGIYSDIEEILSVPKYPEIAGLDATRVGDIENILGTLNEISTVDNSIPSFDELNSEKLIAILDLAKLMNELNEVVSYSSSLAGESEEVSSDLNEVVSKAHKEGIYFTVCKNCGSWVQVGTNCSD